MPRAQFHAASVDPVAAAVQSSFQLRNPHLICSHCDHTLECVEQNRRAGTWLGSLICPNCRSEYLYAYRWGRLMRRG